MAINREWQIKEATKYWESKADNATKTTNKKQKKQEPIFKYEYDKLLWQSGRWPYPRYTKEDME